MIAVDELGLERGRDDEAAVGHVVDTHVSGQLESLEQALDALGAGLVDRTEHVERVVVGEWPLLRHLDNVAIGAAVPDGLRRAEQLAARIAREDGIGALEQLLVRHVLSDLERLAQARCQLCLGRGAPNRQRFRLGGEAADQHLVSARRLLVSVQVDELAEGVDAQDEVQGRGLAVDVLVRVGDGLQATDDAHAALLGRALGLVSLAKLVELASELDLGYAGQRTSSKASTYRPR